MAFQNHRSGVSPLQAQDELAKQAESTAALLTAFADDAARHHDIQLAADLDVEALIFSTRAQFHRMVRRANTPETPRGSKQKER